MWSKAGRFVEGLHAIGDIIKTISANCVINYMMHCYLHVYFIGLSMPTSSSLLITATIAYYSEYVHLQNFLLPSSLPPPRALQLSTSTLPSSFFVRVTSHEHGACPPRLYTVVYWFIHVSQ
jgi:hypothetical protein